MIADLESRINSTMAYSARISPSIGRKWLNVLKDMYVFYDTGYTKQIGTHGRPSDTVL